MSIDFKALYPKLINLLLDTVFVVDEFGHIVFVSDACEQLLGYSANEMIDTRILNYIHPDDLDRTLVAIGNVMSGQSHTDFENRYLHKDGSVVQILWSARWSEQDRLRIAVARNVTALRQADQTRNALYRISEAAHAAETLRALCDGVREVIGELFPESDLCLGFYDAAGSLLSVPDWIAGRSGSWIEKPVESGTAIADVINAGQALLASRDPARQGVGLNDLTQPEGANWLGVPLISRDAVLGVLVIESPSPGTRYREADQALLQFVATQLATVVERKRAEERLRFMAHHDALTGLTNRSLFYDRLETALRSANRNEGRLALLYLDVDDFKRINDTGGHEAGDQLLVEIARRLEDCTRETDTVARMGGDEFTVLLTDVHGRDSVETAVAKVYELTALPMNLEGQTFHISCSIGTALYPEDGMTARELLSKADANMYLGKRHAH
ncbi:diguanylate cyclase domain-containing protein [Marinobacter metalliresistant]|uniref:Diguanylate cyclase n=1 Tax=Marinobacter metalliresistant TaxID=2961995 RepID=A0ABZ2W1E2_9GAMM